MKRIFIFFFLVLLLISTNSSRLFSQIIDENFDYPNGNLISDYGWIPISGIGINPIKVVEPGLDYPCYECTFGNAARLVNTGEDVLKFLNYTVSSGSAYFSFMVKVDSAQTGDYFFHLSDTDSNNNNRVGQVFVKKSGNNIAFGLAKKTNNSEIYTPAIYSTNVTYLLVLKYQFIAGVDNDEVSLFIFDGQCAPVNEPAPTLGPIGGPGDLPNIGKVALQQGAGPKGGYLVIDGICGDVLWDNGALPVELTSFTSNVNRNDVTLNWTTASEINNSGFNIERKLTGSADWKVVGNVSGNGTSSSPHQYNFTDKNLTSGQYNYRLKQIDYNGGFEYFNLISNVGVGIPAKFNLSQNYPNPFNPSTTINFDLPADGYVSLKVFNTSGKEVATLVNETRTSGYHTVNFNASNLSSGVYYYRLEANGFTKVMKMALIK